MPGTRITVGRTSGALQWAHVMICSSTERLSMKYLTVDATGGGRGQSTRSASECFDAHPHSACKPCLRPQNKTKQNKTPRARTRTRQPRRLVSCSVACCPSLLLFRVVKEINAGRLAYSLHAASFHSSDSGLVPRSREGKPAYGILSCSQPSYRIRHGQRKTTGLNE